MRRPRQADITIGLELRALEKMAAALCRHIELLRREAEAAGELKTREAELQQLAFEERRQKAMRLMREHTAEPPSTRIGRLERLIEALETSRSYFLSHRRTPR